jgi:hypothetical protein
VKTIKFRWTGISPLLMQSVVLADPIHPTTVAIKEFTSKRSKDKTEADHMAIAKLEFMANIYYDESLGPYLPGLNIDACIRDGAKHMRKGKTIERGFTTFDEMIPLSYSGPRALEALWSDKRFVDRRAVGVQQSKTMRTRPIFRQWSVEFETAYDEEVLDFETVRMAAEKAGRYSAVGTYRPRYGRFQSEVIDHG